LFSGGEGMHKKIIHGKEYYYASYREDGKVKSKYLGSDKELALQKEREMNGEKNSMFMIYGLVGLLLVLSLFGMAMDMTGYASYSLNESLSAQNLAISDAELDNSVDLGLDEESLSVQNLTLDDVVSNETIDSGFEIIEDVNESVEEVNESLNVSVEVPLVNLTANETVEDVVNISPNITEETVGIVLNITNEIVELNVTTNYSISGVDVVEEVVQYGAVIGEPVKWKKKVVASEEVANLTVEIPENAENVSVKDVVNDVDVPLSDIKVNDSGFIKDIEDTDYVVNEVSGFFSFITGFFNFITGMFVLEEQGNVSLIIEEEVSEVEVEYYTEAPLAVEEDTVYGKKVVVSSDVHYENILTYTFIPDAELDSIELYWIVNGSRVAFEFDGYDTNDDGLVDYLEWVTPHTSEQEFEIELEILNVQSYPIVGGSWIVRFNTTGNADLMVVAINETTFGNSTPDDLEFLEIRCGSEVVNSSYNGTVFVSNYSCGEVGYEESLVLTSGVHDLEFRFGDLVGYAHNDASNKPTQGTPILNATTLSNATSDNLTVYNVSTADLDGDPVKNLINWYNDSTSITELNFPMEGGSLNGTVGGVNDAVRDYSGNGNNGSAVNAKWYRTSGYDGWGAYYFDGSGDYFTIANSASLDSEAMTIVFWVNTSDTGDSGDWYSSKVLFERDQAGGGNAGWAVALDNGNGKIKFVAVDDGLVSTTDVSDSQWHQVALVKNKTTKSIYIDGAFEVSEADSGSIVNNEMIYVACEAVSDYFTGWLDEIVIYNRDLSAEQIRALYMNQTEVLVSQETVTGQVWNATMTPNDGYINGATAWSNSLTILNSAPTQSTPILNATTTANLTSANLTVYNVSTADADGNPVKNVINWFKDGISLAVLNMPMEGHNSNTSVIKDYSGYGNNGTLVWGAVNPGAYHNLTGGYDGFGAFEFDGVDDYIDVGNPTTLGVSDTFTMAAWVKADSEVPGGDSFAIVSKRNSSPYWHWRIGVGGAQLLLIHNGTSLTTSSGAISGIDDGTWYHLAVTKNGTDLSFYVNGAFDRTQTSVPGSIVNGNDVFIGKYNVAGAGFFNGTIDEVMIINRSLSANQILAIYENQTNFIHSNETSVGEVWNATVTPNDGLIDGATTWSNSVTVVAANSAPTVGNITMNSTSSNNYSNGTLQSYWDMGDADGDSQSLNETRWFKDDALQSGLLNSTTVDGGNISQSEVWNLSIRVYDGTSWSAWSSNVSISIVNAIPIHDTPILNATTTANLTSGNLTVYNVSTADADGGAVKNIINWYKNSTSISVLNMPFEGDSNSSNTKDYSELSYNGTRYNAVWNGTGGYDGFGAYEFDGSGDYIDLGDKIDIGTATDLSISLWIKTLKNTQEIIAKSAGSTPLYRLQVTTTGAILARVNDGSNNIPSIGTTNVSNNDWYHVAWTLDRDGDQVIYVNGIEEDRDSISSVGNLDTSGILAIGRFGSSATSYFNGSIDDVMIFNSSLSAEQVRALYMNQTNVIVSQETSTGDVWNATITPNDGTVDGATTWSNSLTVLNSAPTQGTPTLNATTTANLTSANLTVWNVSTADADGGAVKNVYNWYLNGNSLTVLNMPFEGDTNSTNAKDYSGSDNNGTNVGATWSSSGGFDGFGAYEFDGSSSYIEITNSLTNSLSSTTQGTWSMWWKPVDATPASNDRVFGFADTNANEFVLIQVSTDAKFRAIVYDAGSLQWQIDTNSAAFSNGVWTHVALVQDGVSPVVYVNGVEVAQTFISSNDKTKWFNDLTGLDNGFIGTGEINNGGKSNYFEGSVDDILVFNSTLSPEQIRALYMNQTDKIVSQETSTGDVWNATVTPNDGLIDGATIWSNTLTVLNSAPTVGNITMNSTSVNNYSNGTLQSSWDMGDADADSQVLNETRWFKDGALQSGLLNSTTVAGGNISKDEVWNLSIRVYDGTVWSSWSANVSISIVNAAPIQNTPTLNATTSANLTSANLTVWNVSTADADGGAVKNIYNWYLNGNSTIVLNMPFENNGSDEGGKDYSGYENNGTNAAATWNLTGGYDGFGAYTFSGASQTYFKVLDSTSLSLTKDRTISTWVYFYSLPSDTQDAYVISKDQSSPRNWYVAVLNGGDVMRFYMNDGSNSFYKTGVTSLQVDTWYHLAAVYDTSVPNITMYINGVEEGGTVTGTIQSATSDTNNDLYIGSRDGDSSHRFSGNIDEVMIWNRSLSAEQVRAIYMNQTNVIVSQEISAADVWNATITPNDGTIDGATVWSNSVTVVAANFAPTVGNITMNSTSSNNYSNGTLQSSWDMGDADVDSQVLNETRWFRDGILQVLNSTTVDLGNLTGGEVWNLSIRVYDGTVWSAWSSNVSISLGNPPPYVTNLVMNSTNANNYSNGTLQSSWTFSDLDSDSQVLNETKWFKDGALQSGLLNSTTVVAGNLSGAEVWNLSVRLYDGTSWSGWSYNVSISILNSAPHQGTPVLNATTSANLTSANLTVYNVSTADADGGAVKNIINWYKNGTSITVLNMPFENNGSDEGGKDYSGYENNGTKAGATWNSTGGYDGFGAYEFDGVNDKIVVSDNNKFDFGNFTDFSLSYWINDDDGVGEDVISKRNGLSSAPGFFCSNAGTDKVYCEISDTEFDEVFKVGTVTVADGTWHHVSVTFDRDADMSIYVDGAFDVSSDISSIGDINTTKELLIGLNGNGARDYNGSIDEVMVFNHSLSAEQVRALYMNQSNKMVSQETSKGDVWNATVTPNDGLIDGATVWSNSVTILNSAPTQGTPILNATTSSNTTSDNLTVYNVSTADADSDNVKNVYNWYLNGNSTTVLNIPFENNGSDEGGKDYSGYGNNGTNIGATWNSTGGYDGFGAYEFDGNADSINVSWSSSLNITGPISISSWIYIKGYGPSDHSHIAGKLDEDLGPYSDVDYYIGLFSRDPIFIIADSSTGTQATDTTDVPLNTWVHIVATWDGTTNTNGMKMYRNGNLSTETTSTISSIEGSTSKFHVGTRDYTYEFNGTIDEVMVWNRSLSAEQVEALYMNQTNKIVSQEISSDDVWNVTITPNDGLIDGASVWSNSLTISNSAPTVGNITMNSTSVNNYSNGTLQSSWDFGDADADSQVLNETRWFKDGALQSGLLNSTDVALGNLTGGEVWNLSIRVYDGTVWSSWSSNVSVTLGNPAPYITNLVMNSTSVNNYSNGTLQSSWTFNDLDSDSQVLNETRWFKDGSLQSGLLNFTTIVAGNLTGGEVWNLSIRVYDGTSWSGWSSNVSVTLSNPAPYVTNLVMNSTSVNNYSNSTLQSSWTFNDLDSDSQVLNETRWFKDGALQIINSTNVVAGNLTGGEVWNLSIRVYDGTSWSGWSSNVSVTLDNPAPYVTNFAMNATSSTNYSNSTLQTSWTFSDLDSDSEVLNETRWFKDSALQSSLLNSTSVTEGNVSKEEVWNFSVRVFDGTSWGGWIDNLSVTTLNAPPYQGVPSLNFSGTNITTDNITLYNYSSDVDSDSVKNIVNWYKDGASLTVLNMPFDINGSEDNSSGVKDYSEYSNNGTLGNATFEFKPVWNQSGGYDGSGAYVFYEDYIAVPNDGRYDFEDENFSIVFWMKNLAPVSDTEERKMVSNGRVGNNKGYYVGYQASNDRLYFGDVGGAGYVNSVGFSDGGWHHVAAVYTEGYNYSLYFDGDALSITLSGVMDGFNATGEELCIGSYIYGYSRFEFNGSLDEVMIFNQSLSVEQVRAIYASDNVIVAEEIGGGDVWNASVTPNDGFVDGATVWTNSLTVLNSLPSFVVTMNSSSDENLTSGNLQSSWTFSDIDGDSQVLNETRWSKDDALQSGLLNSTTVASANLTGGDVWSLSVRIYDGNGWSSWSDNLSVTIVAVAAEEEEAAAVGGGGGGGGGGSSKDDDENESIIRAPEIPVQSFSVDEYSFDFSAVKGFITSDSFEINNNLLVPIEVTIELIGLDILDIEGSVITLQPGESRSISFNLVPTETGVFAGTIKLYYGNEVFNIPVSINVQSEKSLFDINVNLFDKRIAPGDKITGQIFLLQAGFQQKEDVTLNYVVKDFYGNTLLTESDTIAVFEQALFNKELDISGLPVGDYVYGAEVVYSGGVATASEQFAVVDTELSESQWILTLTLSVVVLIFLIIVIVKYKKLLPFR
jgi:hypothetical protein